MISDPLSVIAAVPFLYTPLEYTPTPPSYDETSICEPKPNVTDDAFVAVTDVPLLFVSMSRESIPIAESDVPFDTIFPLCTTSMNPSPVVGCTAEGVSVTPR